MKLWILPALVYGGLAVLIAGSVTVIFFNSPWGNRNSAGSRRHAGASFP